MNKIIVKSIFIRNQIIYIILIVAFSIIIISCNAERKIEAGTNANLVVVDTEKQIDDYEIIIGSFLGDEKRCNYGSNPPSSLNLIWKCWLSGAPSHMPYNNGSSNMRYGAGWTGQPLLFREKENLYLIQGSYDYNLRKIDVNNGEVIWKYSFCDAIKGTGTLWRKKYSEKDESELVVLQGSRQSSISLYNYRGISAINGEELFRLKVMKTPSFSCDVDGSALVFHDTAYIGFENGLFEVFNPNDDYALKNGQFYEPEIINELKLYTSKDIARVGGNIITESSPTFLGRKVFIATGSRYVFGYNIEIKGKLIGNIILVPI